MIDKRAVNAHEMRLVITHPSGAEEWLCPVCGRRFVLVWQPFKRIILDAGDETAQHSGGKGGLQIGAVDTQETRPTTWQKLLDGGSVP